MKKRILSFLMLTVMLFSVFAFVACDDDPETPPPADGTVAQALKDAGFNRIIYSVYDGSTEECTVATDKIAAKFKELTGAELHIMNDSTAKDSTKKEIVIGKTKRDGSSALNQSVSANRENSAKDYQITMNANEVQLAVGDDLGFLSVSDAFVALLAQPAASYPLDAGYDSGIVQYAWEWATLGGANIKDYKIIYPAKLATVVGTKVNPPESVKDLQEAIFAVCGYELELVADDVGTASAKEILVGHTNRTESAALAASDWTRNNISYDYKFQASGTKILIMGGDDTVSTDAAIEAFIATHLTAEKAQALAWNHHYIHAGLQDITFGGTPAGDFKIVISKTAAFDIEYAAIRLRDFILEQSGYNLEIITDATTRQSGAHEIILGRTTRTETNMTFGVTAYNMAMQNGHLRIKAGNYYGVVQALQALVAEIKVAHAAGTAYAYATNTVLSATTLSSDNGTDSVATTWTGTTGNTAANVASSLGVTNTTGTYELVWNDEFDNYWGDNWFDLNKWHMHDSMGGSKWTDVYYSSKQEDGLVKVENGNLVMQTVMQNSTTRPFATHQAVVTNDTMNFKYGYLEMKGLPPYKAELEWPSFWAHSGASTLAKERLGTSYTDTMPYQIEVDYFEIFSSYSTVPNMHKWHAGASNSQQLSGVDQGNSSGTPTKTFNSQQINEMHTYGFLWTENFMAFSIDGEFYFSYNINENFGTGTMDGFTNAYLQVIFNTTIFSPAWLQTTGSWANTAARQETVKNLATSNKFPYVFTVDYVRLYQIKNYGGLLCTDTDDFAANEGRYYR